MQQHKASKIHFLVENDSFNREKTEEVLRKNDISSLEEQFKKLVEKSWLTR